MNRFDFDGAAAASRRFTDNYETAHAEFPDFFVPIMMRYWRIFHQPTMDAAEAVERDGIALVDFPDVWKAYLDDALVGESLGLYDPRSPKTSWMDLKTFSATIDEQGFPIPVLRSAHLCIDRRLASITCSSPRSAPRA